MGFTAFFAPLRVFGMFRQPSRENGGESLHAKNVRPGSDVSVRRVSRRQRRHRKPLPTLAIEEVQALTCAHAATAEVSRDGRVRLRGSASLDICASPAQLTRAMDAFDQWLAYLRLVGIPVEMRLEDGWRVCAIFDGVPAVIRVRERMRRVSSMNRVSGFLEAMLGGRVPEVMEPSGHLEAQVMRFGVCAARMPLDDEPGAWDFRGITAELKEAARRETLRVAKQRRRAEKLRFYPVASAEPPKAAKDAGQDEMRKRFAELTSTLESLLAMQLIHPSNAYLATHVMDSSLHQLASRCGASGLANQAAKATEQHPVTPVLVARKGGRRQKIA